MYKTEKLDQLVDPVMGGEVAGKEAVRFLKVGLMCVQEKCDRRPSISKALSLMSDQDMINLDDLQILPPGIITDIMDVKLGRRRSSRSLTTTASHRFYNF